MSPLRRAPAFRLLSLLAPLLGSCAGTDPASPRRSPSPTPALAQACWPPSNPNYVFYNRCTWAHIGDQGAIYTCHPWPTIDGVLPIDSAEEKISYRFTLSTTLAGPQSVNGVWIYYETLGDSREYELSLRRDVNGRPANPLGRSRFWSHAVPGTKDWHFVPLTTNNPLLPGRVYHVLVTPRSNSAVDAENCIAVITARSKCPVPYVPTDGTGTAAQSPFDPWLAVMKSPGAPLVSDFLVQADRTLSLSPIFALDLGAAGIVGQPYDGHRETTISQQDQYGQAITVTSTQVVNYAAFFLRGMGCPPPEGCPTAIPNCQTSQLPHPFGELRLVISSPTDPLFEPVDVPVLPANYDHHVYLKRSHWFGATLPDVTLTPGTYYFALKSPDCAGVDPVLDHDGWTFTAEGSTLPLPDSVLPTYARDASYAIESHDGGETFQPMQDAAPLDGKRWDAGFILGNFPGGLSTPLAILDDATVTAQCSGQYAHSVPLATRVFFDELNRNIGAVPAIGPNRIYLRLLDLACNELHGPVDGGAGQEIPVNLERLNLAQSLSCRTGFAGTTDAFLLLELGHFEGTTMVRDDLVPYEVRVGPCQ